MPFILILIVLAQSAHGQEKYDPTLKDPTISLAAPDMEKRYSERLFKSAGNGSFLTFVFRNQCPASDSEYRLLDSEGAAMGTECPESARGESAIIPEGFSVVRGSVLVLPSSQGDIAVAYADSTRTITLSGTGQKLQLRAGHLRARRIDAYGIDVAPGDSLVLDMVKTFMGYPQCNYPLGSTTDNHPLASYLLMDPNDMYFRVGGRVIRPCLRGVERYLMSLPREYR